MLNSLVKKRFNMVPLGDRLFEIKYVERENPFYMLQKNYTFKLRCELFRYEDEVIDTNVETIDDNVQEDGYIQKLSLVGVGTTATAITSLLMVLFRRSQLNDGLI